MRELGGDGNEIRLQKAALKHHKGRSGDRRSDCELVNNGCCCEEMSAGAAARSVSSELDNISPLKEAQRAALD